MGSRLGILALIIPVLKQQVSRVKKWLFIIYYYVVHID